MLTSKQRSILKKMANDIPDVIHVGKEGITAALIRQTNDAIIARELIKGKVQKNASFSSETIGQELADAVKAEVVSIIGSKFILYKKNLMKTKIIVPSKNTKPIKRMKKKTGSLKKI